MMYWNGDWSWGAGLVMAATMLLFWGAVAWVLVTMVRGDGSRGTQPPPAPEEILRVRLARGEITSQEYEELRDLIRRT